MSAQAQHLTALELANRRRRERAAERCRVEALPRAEGLEAVAALFEDPPAHLASAKPTDVLEWPERNGAAYARRIAGAAGLSAWSPRLVGELTERERGAIAAELRRLAR